MRFLMAQMYCFFVANIAKHYNNFNFHGYKRLNFTLKVNSILPFNFIKFLWCN